MDLSLLEELWHILEDVGRLFEHSLTLLEQSSYLFEQLVSILENPAFIRRFLTILEHPCSLLEKTRQI